MLVLPAVLAVALVGPVIGVSGQFGALPLRFSGPLAGLMRTEPLGLGTGIGLKETPAMGTAHLAVHGVLLCEAVFSQRGFDRKNKNHNQSRCGRRYTFSNERSGEEKLRGQFAERCPWFTFSPVLLAHILAGDNTRFRQQVSAGVGRRITNVYIFARRSKGRTKPCGTYTCITSGASATP
jgi:hypothetical protein